MSPSNVIAIATPATVDAAWNALRDHRSRILDDPRCLLDREFVEKDAKLENRFKRLYLCGEFR